MMKYRTIVAAFFVFAIPSVSSAQCCSAGNPSSYAFSDQTSLKARSLLISSSFKYGYSGKYFSGDQVSAMNLKTPASFSFIDLRASYGISQRFAVQTETGYYISKVQENPDPYPADRGKGLGDAAINVRYRFLKNLKHHLELNGSAGVRLPVGVFDQEKDGVKLPLTIQPSSGSLVYLAGISAAKTLSNDKWRLFAVLSAEFPQLIDSRNFYYQYGNLYNLSLAVVYPVHKLFTPALQLQGEMRSHATREAGQVVEASGYRVISLSPYIESAFAENWIVNLYADIPVYKYFNGIQLANSFKAGIKLTRRISL